MDLRRLRLWRRACGAALVVLVVPSLRFALASQAGLVIGWRAAAMPPNILAAPPGSRPSGSLARIPSQVSKLDIFHKEPRT